MSTALRCAGLGHRYGRRLWGLRDCNLDVPTGRVVALVGPNGSGKTTLMSMAAGLLPVTAGTVEAAGGPRRSGWTGSGSSLRTRRCGRACALPMSWT
jgi:ABC-2 type transport system ATP-binding protein